ncbi:SusC/RagA family TonB-linked outer membrane protein [Flavobacterium piscis]|uniref:TonB-linked SusC/RagA family outer membrane protein n=1 Tax=Flavobacterium piscis TaxID=1114874 RepID=A0ABU1YE87_9FLAO|nr:SusC/RagA family TonB-linked outer membrane protein [Flavobacterium piscis]MDR7212550.1 TonB-linked SusC/RagA family outer membrane protein [Flavobacterium piscis]
MKQTLLKRCSFLLFFALMSMLSNAQTASSQIKITGTVTDNSGLLLPGVNVTEKSSKNTVTTDYNGKYEINVKPGATLVFSYIGMRKIEIPLAGRTVLDTKLQEDSNVLDDIVVVAYGTQKKNNITGAIATIKPDDIQDLPVSNLSEALRGQIPGLSVSGGSGRPGDAASIQIRQTFGFSKDGNSTNPLIVIDDMVQIDPTTGLATLETFNRLDPSEIESITVLKDGSAAIYGSRASQGAVIVKTKRGQNSKLKFSYYSQYSFNDAVSHSKTMSAYEHGIWKNRFLNSNLDTNTAKYFSDEELEQMKSLDYDWLKKAWKPAIQQRHSLTASGGNEKATYFAGITYFDQGANLGEQDYNKWNFRTGMTAKLAKDFELAATISANAVDVERSFSKAAANLNDSSFGSAGGGEQADYGYLLHMPKYIPWQTTVEGKDYWLSPIARSDRNLGSANANNTIAGWNYFASLDSGKQVDQEFSYNVNLSLNYKVSFIKGLSLKGSYARSQSSANTEQVQLPYDLARIRNYETADNHLVSAADPTFYNNVNNPSGDYLLETNVRNSRVYYNTDVDKVIQANFFANYARTFGNHAVDGMFGIERSESSYQSVRLAYEGTSKDYLGSNTTAGTISSNSTATKGESGTFSYLGRANYSYKDTYLVQLLFRSDASTKFAPDNYWGFFPSAQFGWVASNEGWFKDALPAINNLKFRYSIGKTGKDNIKPWRWLTLYDIIVDKGNQFGSAGGTLGGAITPRPTPNEDIRWDSTIKHNFGIDLSVLNNRLQISADYYYDKTTDMLITMAGEVGTPISVGGAFAEQNYAAVNAWGTEFSLNWKDRIKRDLSYNVGVNFGISDNEVKRYPGAAVQHPSYNAIQPGYSNFTPVWGFRTWKETSTGDGILRTDEDVTNYWNYLTANATAVGGVPNYLGINNVTLMRKGMLAYEDVGGAFDAATNTQAPADGQIARQLDYIKLAKNNRTYGFTSNLGMNYKSFYFKTQIATSWGGYNSIDLVKQGTSSAHNDWGHETFWSDMYDATDNPNGKYPNMGQADTAFAPSDFWELSNFRCTVRNLTVGFELPQEALKTINIQRVTLGITGNNLWDLYNPYPDNYRNMYDTSSARYPTLRTWSVNMNVTF